jgi:hypothetical protein
MSKYKQLNLLAESNQVEIYCTDSEYLTRLVEWITEDIPIPKINRTSSHHVVLEDLHKSGKGSRTEVEWEIMQMLGQKRWEPFATSTGGYWHVCHYRQSYD